MTRRWIVLGLIFIGILVSYIDRGNLSIAAVAIMRDFRLPPSSMGVLLSSFFWTYAFFQIPAGLAVDRFGIRSTYAAAVLVWSLASAAIALTTGSAGMLSLRMLLGLAESVAPLASLAFIRHNFSGREHGLPVSVYISGQTLGPAVGTLLGSVLLVDFGWRIMFAVTGLSALLWIPFWLYFAPRGGTRQAASPVVPPESPRFSWPDVLSNRAFWALSACSILLAYYWYFILTWMPSYLIIARGFSTLGMGRILSTPLFIMAAINLGAGWIADRLVARTGSVFRVRVWFVIVGLLGAASILLLEVVPGRAPVLPLLTVSICSFGIANSSYWAISQHTPPPGMVGRTIGYLNTVSQIGGILAPLITGWTLGPHKHFEVALLLAGCCPLLGSLLLWLASPNGLDKLKACLSSSAELQSLRT
jgi:MFS transporter, ACS family, D-galactonate transporter